MPLQPGKQPGKRWQERLQGRWQEMVDAYAHGEDRPLGSYLVVMGLWGGVAGGLLGLARRSGRWNDARISPLDLALLGLATHKVSRLVAKDPVTSPLRAPFARYVGTSGEAELAEEVRGTGMRKALGELLTCPFCIGQWVATGFTVGYAVAPGLTRLAAAPFAELAIADFLQLGYAAAQQGQQQLGDQKPGGQQSKDQQQGDQQQ